VGSNGDGIASDIAGSTDSAAAASSNGGKPADTAGTTTTNENSASSGLALTTPLTIGVAVLIWQAFQRLQPSLLYYY
jgi:hypothetical protein